MTYSTPRTTDDCTVDDVTLDGHDFKNSAKQGEKPLWQCVHCGLSKSTKAPAPV